MSQAADTWVLFLADARVHLGEAARLVEGTPVRAALTAAAGELFALRTGAQLLGVDGAARLAAAIEREVDRAAAGTPWAGLRDAVAQGLRALDGALLELERPDASGARIDMTPIEAALGSLDSQRAERPIDAARRVEPGVATGGGVTDEDAWVPLVDEDMIDPFIEEATERLDALAQKLLRLEQGPGDRELIREVFRDLHTIKGSSAFVGLRKMNRLAHAAEDLVGQLRDGVRPVDRGVIDALLGALDGLRLLLERAIARAPLDVALDPLVQRLRMPQANVEAVQDEATAHPTPGAPEAHAAAGGARSAKQTLRVDFDKLDLLLNLVGELVLNKASLHAGVAGFAALGRELEGQLREMRSPRGRRALAGSAPTSIRTAGAPRPAPAHLEELGRVSRVFAELGQELDVTVGRLDHTADELRQQVMKLRMLPIARVFNKYHRTVRELAHSLGKQVRLEIVGAETELDKILIEQIDDPLLHLVRNAIDHGCEAPERRAAAGKPAEATVTLSAHHRGSQIWIEVTDDGAGIEPARLRKKAVEKGLATALEADEMDDRAVLDIIFRPGFSTAARVSEVSGRGVGMDVVREAITRLKGSIDIASQPGVGTTFTLKLPLTLAIIQVLLVRVAGHDLAIPLDVVQRTLSCRFADLHQVQQRLVLLTDGAEIPVIPVALALQLGGNTADDDEIPLILVDVLGDTYALVCDRLVGKREIVIKSLGDLLEEVPCVAGATLLGDQVVLILDVPQVVQQGVRRFVDGDLKAPPNVVRSLASRGLNIFKPIDGLPSLRARVLVAEDSDLVRESLRRLFANHGYEVVAAHDGAVALELAERDERGFDVVSTDVMMPNLDGYELCRRLRLIPRYHDVPIIMVTARGEKVDRVRGFDAGVDEYIVKPVDHGEILRAVERQLRRGLGQNKEPV